MEFKNGCSEFPLLSIVIANYNYGRFLAEAIESIVAQGVGSMVEIIVCDAASTDNSLEVISRYSEHISWWCSEKDGGQSAAFNKGFSHARGRFLTWLNADDVLLPGSLRSFKAAVERCPQQEWWAGGVMWLTKDMRVARCGRGRSMSRLRARHGYVNVCGPSSIFSRSLYERVGRIDERFHYTMDTDLWLRMAILAGSSFRPFCKYAWGLRIHEAAKMSGHKVNADGTLKEGKESQEAFLKDKKRLNQLKIEATLTEGKIGLGKKKMSYLRRVLSAAFVSALLSRFDTWRVAGAHYLKAMEVVG